MLQRFYMKLIKILNFDPLEVFLCTIDADSPFECIYKETDTDSDHNVDHQFDIQVDNR